MDSCFFYRHFDQNSKIFFGFVLNKDLHESLRSPLLIHCSSINFGLPWGLAAKYPPNNGGDADSFPELGRFPGEGNGNPFQCSCLGNATDRRAGGLQSIGWQRIRHDLATKQLQNSNK